jgi:hypothetical protein
VSEPKDFTLEEMKELYLHSAVSARPITFGRALKEMIRRFEEVTRPISKEEWDAYTIYPTLSREHVNGLLKHRVDTLPAPPEAPSEL